VDVRYGDACNDYGIAMSVLVVIKGKTYPTILAAAQAMGVSPQAIWQRMERGTLDKPYRRSSKPPQSGKTEPD